MGRGMPTASWRRPDNGAVTSLARRKQGDLGKASFLQHELGPMPSRRPQGSSSHRGVYGKLPFAVRSSDVVMAEGGYEEREEVPGGRRSGGLFHGEVDLGTRLREAEMIERVAAVGIGSISS